MKDNEIANDHDIAKGICNNDRRAYAEFMNRYFNLVLFLCRKSCPCSRDAEELCNDILLKIFRKIHLFDPEKGSLKTWITVTAANHIRDQMKKEDHSEYELSLEGYPGGDDDDEDAVEYDNEEYEQRERAGTEAVPVFETCFQYDEDGDGHISGGTDDPGIICLRKAMKYINERDRTIVTLWAEGIDNKEIMELLHIKYKTVTTARSRAIKKIKAVYNREWELLQKKEKNKEPAVQRSTS